MDNKVAERRAIGLMVANHGDRAVLASFLGELGYTVVAPAPDAGGAPPALGHCSLIVADETAAHQFADSILKLKERAGPVVLPILVALPAQAPAAPWLRRGFDEVLRMPIAKSDLLARIETFLRLRRQSEEALRASEAFSRATLDAIASNVCVVDAGGRITLVNRAWRQFAQANGGPASETCEGSDYLQACRADAGHQDAEIRGAAEQILAVLEGNAQSCAVEYPSHAPGERRWFLASAVRFDGGGAPFIVVTHTDVTARYESELRARESNERFRSLTELSSDYFWETDAEHRFIARNSSASHPAAAIFPLETMLGKHRWELPGVQVAGNDWNGHREDLAARRPFRGFEFAVVTQEGALLHYSISGAPVFGEDGGFVGYRGTGADITSRKREERLLAMEHSVTRCLAEAENGPAGLRSMIRIVCEVKGWACGRYWQLDATAGVMRASESWSIPDAGVQNYLATSRELEVAPGRGVMGEVLVSGEMAWVTDLASDPRAIHPEAVRASGLHGACVVPVTSQGATLGVLAFLSQSIRKPDQRLLEALNAVGGQLGQFLKRKEAEGVLRESEQRYRSLSGLAADWYWETDADYRLSHVRQRSHAVGLRNLAKVLGRRPWEIDYEDRSEPGWAGVQAAMHKRRVVREFEVTAQGARGALRSILISGHPVFDGDGRFTGYRGISRDVTERRRAERFHELEHAVVRCLASNDDPALALDEVLEAICRSWNLAMGRYMEVDEAAGVLRFVSAWAEPGNEAVHRYIDFVRAVEFTPGQGSPGQVWQSGQPLWIADLSEDKHVLYTKQVAEAGLRSSFLLPVSSQGKVIGVLTFAGDRMREPDDRMLKTALAIGGQLGQFLGRARSQAQLRRNEARFRSLTELSADWYWEQDAELRFVSFSGGNGTPDKLAQEQVRAIGLRRWELAGATPVNGSWDEHRAVLAARQTFRNFEYRRDLGDGEVQYTAVSGEPMFDHRGQFTGYRGLSTDITARKREQHLAELEHAVARLLAAGKSNQDTLQSVIALICGSESITCGRYFEVDERTNCLRFVDAWGAPGESTRRLIDQSREMTVKSGEGLAGIVWQSGVPLWVEDAEQDPRFLSKGLATGAGMRSAFVVPVLSSGHAIGVLYFFSQHMRAPDELLLKAVHSIGSQLGQFLGRARGEEKSRRFRAALDASGDAILLIDRTDLRYVDVNQTFCDLVGYSREEVLRMSPMELFSPDRETLERDYDALIAAGDRAVSSVRGEYRRKDGSRVAVESNRRALRTDDGWIIVANARDISERVAHERALKESNARLARHALRQTVAAAFGQFALESRGEDALVHEAIRVLADFADGILLFELTPGVQVVVRHGAGDGTAALIGNETSVTPGGATDKVMRTGVSVRLDEANLRSRPPGVAWSVWASGMRSAMFVPVSRNSDAHRALALYSKRAQAFGDEDLRFAESIANALSTALQREEAERRGKIQRWRQEQIASYGQFALKRQKAGELVGEAVAMLGERADVAAFFEVENRQSTVLRMAVGPGTGTSVGQQAAFRPDSAVGRVLEGGRSVRVAQDYFQSAPDEWPWASWIRQMSGGVFVPVTHNGHAHGALALFSKTSEGVSDEEMRYAEAIGHLLSTALQRERAEENLARQSLRQQRIAELGHRALMATDVEALIADCMRVALQEGADAAAIFEFDAGAGRFSLRGARGIESDNVLGKLLELCGDCPVGTAFGAEEPLLVRDHGVKPCGRVHGGWGGAMRSSVNVQIRGEKSSFGVLSVFSKTPDAFSDDDVKYLQAVANMVSSAIQRIQGVQRLAFMAQFDPLTSLANRSLLQDRLEQTIVQSARKNWQAGVLFIDLDRFKMVNDSLGHHVGDQLIREVAGRLGTCVRPGDTVGRISGDEFAVVLADLARPDDAALVAQKVQNALAAPFALAGTETFVTASIGIAVFPNDGESADTLLRNADMAMYRAKKSSRNSYRFFTAKMNERAVAKMQLDGDLRRAIERREFLLHYQPKVELAGGALIGMEALLRWNHPQRGLVSPMEFIPALESSGLIIPVGEWVIEEAASQLLRWQDAGCALAPVAINLSPRQFRRRDLDKVVQRTLEAAGVPPGLLELEITESSMADDPEDAVRQLNNLRAAGLKISVDDFGTGYSSLAYLTRLPLSSLKIDRSFVRNAMDSPDAAAIVRAVIDMAHNLRFTVVAEGVETEQQAKFLRLHRCEQAQGYLFGRPMSAADMASRLGRSAGSPP